MRTSELRILEFSDVHLGHPNTPTEHILRGLRQILPDTDISNEIDLIIIAGDLLDRRLALPDDNVHLIHAWMNEVLRICKKRNIVLRVLEGTPSHDWKQSRAFIHENEKSQIGADVKYVETLSIEHIEAFGLDVLYIPDEWRVLCDDTWGEVVALMHEKGMEKVDIAVMHGIFPHQLPPAAHGSLEMHNPDRYLGIVRYFIFIGHVHLQSQNGRILSSGSTDRLVHGEEGPKGHYRVIIRKNDKHEVSFIENKMAKIYKTIPCHGLTGEELLAKVNESVKGLPRDSAVRIRANKLDDAIASMDVFRNLYPNYQWSTKVETGDKKEMKELVDMRKTLTTERLTKANIAELLLKRIGEKRPEMVSICGNLLNGVIHGQSSRY